MSEFGQRAAQLVAGVSAIGKDMAQPWVEALNRSQHANRAVSILNVGRMNLKADEVSLRIRHDVPFAALNLLSRVIAARPAALGCLDRLAIDDTSTRARLATERLARRHDQRVADARPDAVSRPPVEIPLNSRVGRKFLGDLPPLAARRSHVQDGIHHRPKFHNPGPPNRQGSRQKWFDQRPFSVRHIACVAQSLPTILTAGDLSPGHCGLHRLCGTTTESQPIEITQPLFRSGSKSGAGIALSGGVNEPVDADAIGAMTWNNFEPSTRLLTEQIVRPPIQSVRSARPVSAS